MANYLLVYHGGSMPETPEEGAQVMQAWTDWFTASMVRGNARCDYPPGEWHLEVALNPLVDDSPVGGVYLPYATMDVPLEGPDASPLAYVIETRYCGLASAVYREQGEPTVASPYLIIQPTRAIVPRIPAS